MTRRLSLSEAEVEALEFYKNLCEASENEQIKIKALECHANLMKSMLEFEKSRFEIRQKFNSEIQKEEINRDVQITKSEIEYDKERLKN